MTVDPIALAHALLAAGDEAARIDADLEDQKAAIVAAMVALDPETARDDAAEAWHADRADEARETLPRWFRDEMLAWVASNAEFNARYENAIVASGQFPIVMEVAKAKAKHPSRRLPSLKVRR